MALIQTGFCKQVGSVAESTALPPPPPPRQSGSRRCWLAVVRMREVKTLEKGRVGWSATDGSAELSELLNRKRTGI